MTHQLTMAVLEDPRRFQAVCSCGWRSVPMTTNAVMGRGRRHRTAAMKREAVA